MKQRAASCLLVCLLVCLPFRFADTVKQTGGSHQRNRQEEQEEDQKNRHTSVCISMNPSRSLLTTMGFSCKGRVSIRRTIHRFNAECKRYSARGFQAPVPAEARQHHPHPLSLLPPYLLSSRHHYCDHQQLRLFHGRGMRLRAQAQGQPRSCPTGCLPCPHLAPIVPAPPAPFPPLCPVASHHTSSNQPHGTASLLPPPRNLPCRLARTFLCLLFSGPIGRQQWWDHVARRCWFQSLPRALPAPPACWESAVPPWLRRCCLRHQRAHEPTS